MPQDLEHGRKADLPRHPPASLTKAGLPPALNALARRSTFPVQVDARLDARLPAPIEAAAYYIASEALTNVAKYARASMVQLGVTAIDVSAGKGTCVAVTLPIATKPNQIETVLGRAQGR
jgi:hypothetical protein